MFVVLLDLFRGLFAKIIRIEQKAPESGELVIMGIDVKKPFLVVGVVSGNISSLLSHSMSI